MFLAKAVRDAKNESFGNDFFLWEMDKEVTYCRDCRKPFSMALRRHHCRNCGGIYCDDCTSLNVEYNSVKMDRVCKGCIRHEVPGDNVRIAIEKSLALFDTRGNRKVSAANVALTYGSLCDAPSGPSKGDSSPKPDAPTSGYFELANKLNLYCCVKVFYGADGSDVASLWEIPRPSFLPVPPNGIVSGRFDASQPFIEIVLLVGNPNPPESGEIVHETTQSTKKISKSAAVENFRRYMIFRVESAGHNVMLKFKGDTLLEPRLGNSVGRVGIFGKLGMKGEDTKDVINFETNVPSSSIRLFCASAGTDNLGASPRSPRAGEN